MIVFGIHCNFFIGLPIQLKTCRSSVFFFFARLNVRARKIGRVSEVFRTRACLIGIGHAICPGLSEVCLGHIPVNIYLFEINKTNTKKGVKYVQSFQ